MNQQTISAFNTFNTTLTTAVNTLRHSLQQTNSFNSIYTEQFNDILKFHENTKAFTRFLQEQNEYHRKQYAQFKSNNNQSNSNKLQPLNTVSSQLSIQSTPQSLNDWSYTANDRISTGSIPDYQRWRGYDPQPNNNNYLFNEAHIPFKFIDTDNDSDMPSLPPSAPPSVENDENDRKISDTYDIADGNEDDEKWDYPLIKTEAFTGYFESGTDRLPTAQLEFKNDKVLKPPPTKWQEREEQNRRIINTLFQSFQQTQNDDAFMLENNTEIKEECKDNIQLNMTGSANDNSGVESTSVIDSVDDIETVAASDSAMSMNSMGSMRYIYDDNGHGPVGVMEDDIDAKLDCIGMKRRRSMCMNQPCTATDKTDSSSAGGLISNNISFIKGQPPPITFIEYEPPKQQNEYINIEQHPHYHPLIHGNDNDINNENNLEETDDINGEMTASESNENINERDKRNEYSGISQHCNIKQHNNNNVKDINKEIVTLRNALDYHFNVNHNDLNQVKEALYSLRCNINSNQNSINKNNNKKKIKKMNHGQWTNRRKKKTYYLHK